MSLEKDVQTELELRCSGVDSVVDIVEKIKACALLASPDDTFSLYVQIKINQSGAEKKEQRAAHVKMLFTDLRKASGHRSWKAFAKQFGLAESTLFSWLRGNPMSLHVFELIVEKIPEEAMREKFLDAREIFTNPIR